MLVYDHQGRQRDEAWLASVYGARVLYTSRDSAHFALERIDVTEQAPVFQIVVTDSQGQPAPGISIADHWPGVETDEKGVDLLLHTPQPIVPLWRRHALLQPTSPTGTTGFGFGQGSIIGPDGGPHTLWVFSPDVPSDGLAGVGWLGGTQYRGPCRLTFRRVAGVVAPPPPPSQDVLQIVTGIQADVRRLLAHFGLS